MTANLFCWAEFNWASIRQRTKELSSDLPAGITDALDDDSISVTCQLLQDLGIDPHPEDMSIEFCDARAAVQYFVNIALLSMGMFANGDRFACSHDGCQFIYVPQRGWRGPDDGVLSDHEHRWFRND